MIKKRINAIFLAVIMIATVVLAELPAVKAADTDSGLSISAQEVQPGNEFTVSASIPKITQLCAWMDGKITFDKSAFEMTSFEAASIDNTLADKSDDMDVANANGFFSFAVTSSGDGFSLADGYTVTATFKVKEGARGTYNFDIVDLMAYDDNDEPLYDAPTKTQVSINVVIPATKITSNKTELTLKEKTSETLTATVTPANTTDSVSWKSADTNIATVDENGKVTGVAPGTTTITITAGGVNTTCKVTVTCAHANTTSYDAEASTCTVKGHEAYTYCEDCKTVISGSNAELPLAAHTLNHVSEQKATCDVDGNIEYWKCTVCEKYFKDSNANEEIIEKETVITAATGHSNSGEWQTNSEKHWKPCGGCGNIYKFEEGDHKYPDNMSYNETEHWDACTVCGYIANKANHTGGTATCKEQKTCTTCGQKYGELGGHNYVETVDSQYEKTPANCTDAAVYYKSCSVCGKAHETETFTYGSALGHKYSETWSHSETQHWHECSACHDKKDVADHTGGSATCLEKATCTSCGTKYSDIGAHKYEEEVAEKHLKDKATCIKKAVYWKSCSVCDENHKTETFEYGSALGHDYKSVPEKPAKCEEPGKKAYYDCARCDSISLNGTEECTEADLVINPTDHSYVEEVKAEYKVSEATCTEKAVYKKSCSACGKSHATETFKTGEVNAENHVGDTEIRDAKEAKCYETGYTGNTHCKDCGVKIADGKVIDKIPHNITTWEVTKEPTTEETGSKTGYCANEGCTDKHQVIIAKLVATGDKVTSDVKDNSVVVESVTVSKDSNVTESVILQVDNVTDEIKDSEVKDIEKAARDKEEVTDAHKVATILDIKMILREVLDNPDKDLVADTEFKLEGEVEIKLQLPEELVMKYEKLVLLHVKDDGSVEVIPFTMGQDNVVTFKADEFSYYAFAGVEKQPVTDSGVANTNNNTSTSPKTGDNGMASLWVLMAVCALFAMVVLVAKKQKRMF